jgi:hypothetical protein
MDQFARPQRPMNSANDERPNVQEAISMQQPMQNTVTAVAAKKTMPLQKLAPMIMLFAVVGLLMVMLTSIVLGDRGASNGGSISSAVKPEKYQAVFLNSADGQVYFGKLTNFNNQFYRLTDIFYLRVEQKIQPGSTDTTQAQNSVSLAKLGNELHGPEDEMFISKDKVMFWENLKNDGSVVKAITEYKANPTAAADAAAQTGGATPQSSTPAATTPAAGTVKP